MIEAIIAALTALVLSQFVDVSDQWVFSLHRKPRFLRGEDKVLQLLADGRELRALDMVRASDGALRRGTVYILLARMEVSGQATRCVHHYKRAE